MWRALALAATSRESLAEGGGYALALRLLAFAPSHLAPCQAEAALWSAWSGLYSAAAAQAELAVGLPTAHLAHELGERLASVLGPPDATTPALLAAHTACVRYTAPYTCFFLFAPRSILITPCTLHCTLHLQLHTAPSSAEQPYPAPAPAPRSAVEELDLPSLARSLKTENLPLAGFRRIMAPVRDTCHLIPDT